MVLHPRYKRYFRQTLAFGMIWMTFGTVYVFLELGLLGSLDQYPATGNKYDFRSSLLYVVVFSISMGLAHGCIEVFWLKRRLAEASFLKRIFLKGLFYLSFLILFLVVLTLAANAQRYEVGFFDTRLWESLWQFMKNFAFWSVIIYCSAGLGVALFYSEVAEYLGNAALYNFFFGKYHKPKQEVRIFMFLDMKSSTTIAEKIGHVKYFDLLKAYYADMTDAILETSGHIYQYVGDEIVVSWTKAEGVYENNCIHCFLKIFETIYQRQGFYIDRFGLIPEFKAGFHIGEVTIGEIGIIKKDIIYTGDVLNTTARIQTKCNIFNARALLSEALLKELQEENPISFAPIGELILRGKTEAIQLFRIEF